MSAGVSEESLVSGEAGVQVEAVGEHTVFPPFDSSTFPSQLLWLAITFAILYYLLAKVALPRIAGILEVRRDRIASDLDMAERLKTDSEEALSGYERALAQARAKAFGLAESARSQSKAAADAQRAEIEAGLDEKLAAAEARIAEIKAKALADVGAIAGEAAQEIVKRLAAVDVSRGEVDVAIAKAIAK